MEKLEKRRMVEATQQDSMLDRGASADNGSGGGGSLKDRWNNFKMASLFAGVASLFPWNMLIAVSGYWNYKLRNGSDDGGSGGSGNGTDDGCHSKLSNLQAGLSFDHLAYFVTYLKCPFFGVGLFLSTVRLNSGLSYRSFLT